MCRVAMMDQNVPEGTGALPPLSYFLAKAVYLFLDYLCSMIMCLWMHNVKAVLMQSDYNYACRRDYVKSLTSQTEPQ